MSTIYSCICYTCNNLFFDSITFLPQNASLILIYFLILKPFFHKTLFSFYVSLLKTLPFIMFCLPKLYLYRLSGAIIFQFASVTQDFTGGRPATASKTSNVKKKHVHQHQNKRKSRVKRRC